ncbi:hypothetical protein JOS77_12630 [Chromobacterium haemolyticum]|nr:hypothetical protein JOS77_12630 [Chromobacterium haemolyticum]
MKKSPIFVDFSLLRLNPHFRSIFIARMISVFAFGILMVAVPVQIHQLTGSTLQVGAAMALRWTASACSPAWCAAACWRTAWIAAG